MIIVSNCLQTDRSCSAWSLTLGLPVVPLVYTKVARSSGCTLAIWKLLAVSAPSSRTSWNDSTLQASSSCARLLGSPQRQMANLMASCNGCSTQAMSMRHSLDRRISITTNGLSMSTAKFNHSSSFVSSERTADLVHVQSVVAKVRCTVQLCWVSPEREN